MIESICVVILSKHQDIIDIRIKEIISKIIINSLHPRIPTGIFTKNLSQCIVKCKIHHRRQIRIVTFYRCNFGILLPIRHLRLVVHPDFSYNIEFRIFVSDFFCPICNAFFVIVRISIHTETVQTCIFYPPNRILRHIINDHRITLVHIRHCRIKPAVHTICSINF